MRSIAVFNVKGGTGKTTLACNLAAYLGMYRKQKVLVIDADPQMAATLVLLGLELTYNIIEKGGPSISRALEALADRGEGLTRLPTVVAPHSGIDVLPGDLRVISFQEAWSPRGARSRQSAAVVGQLMKCLRDYDLVIFDMAPSASALNVAILNQCDYFITPVSLDFMGPFALTTTAGSIVRLVRSRETPLEFAGFVLSGVSSHSPQRAEMIKRIYTVVEKAIMPNFVSRPATVNDLLLGTVPRLQSLTALSEDASRPIFELGVDDGLVGAQFSGATQFKGVIADIADKLLAIVRAKVHD